MQDAAELGRNRTTVAGSLAQRWPSDQPKSLCTMQGIPAEEALRSSRLGVLLAALQSAEFVLEALATRLAGERGGWVAVSVLELWKAACRLR